MSATKNPGLSAERLLAELQGKVATTTANRPESGGGLDLFKYLRHCAVGNEMYLSHRLNDNYTEHNQHVQRYQPESDDDDRLAGLKAAKELWGWNNITQDVVTPVHWQKNCQDFSYKPWSGDRWLRLTSDPTHIFTTRAAAYEFAAKQWAKSGATIYFVGIPRHLSGKCAEIIIVELDKDTYLSRYLAPSEYIFSMFTPSLPRAFRVIEERLGE